MSNELFPAAKIAVPLESAFSGGRCREDSCAPSGILATVRLVIEKQSSFLNRTVLVRYAA